MDNKSGELTPSTEGFGNIPEMEPFARTKAICEVDPIACEQMTKPNPAETEAGYSFFQPWGTGGNKEKLRGGDNLGVQPYITLPEMSCVKNSRNIILTSWDIL